MSKQQNPYKEFLDSQSEFSHHFACWAKNHMGWAKMKKANKRLAKRRLKRKTKKEMKEEMDYG